MTQPYELPKRTDVRTATVRCDDILEPDTRVAGSINTDAEATFASSDGAIQMAIMRSQSAELRRQTILQQQKERRQREA